MPTVVCLLNYIDPRPKSKSDPKSSSDTNPKSNFGVEKWEQSEFELDLELAEVLQLKIFNYGFYFFNYLIRDKCGKINYVYVT